MKLYRYFLDGVPEYVVRHYWWAYLWRPGIWFFDHQTIVNAILFGNYSGLLEENLKLLRGRPGRTLQLSCVYGELTPRMFEGISSDKLHIADASMEQLRLTRRKVNGRGSLVPVRTNAEALAYQDSVFDTAVIFFLLHEMPPDARFKTLSEAVRVLKTGGRLLITEYGQDPLGHPLYRFSPGRRLIERLEPFLGGFWKEDLDSILSRAALESGKRIERGTYSRELFDGLYKVAEYEVG